MPGSQAKKGHLRTRVEINTPEFILSKYAIVVINTPEPEFCFFATKYTFVVNTHIDQDKINMTSKLFLSNQLSKQFHGSYYCSLIQTKNILKIHYLSMLRAIVEDELKIGDVCWIGLT